MGTSKNLSISDPTLNGEDTKEVGEFSTTRSVRMKCVVALCLLSLVDVLGYSLLSTFFPTLAMDRGLDETQVGMIFSAYTFAGLISSIVTGYQMGSVGPKFFIVFGMILCSGSTLCFSLLYMTTGPSLLWLAIACRLLMGLGSFAAYTAMYAVIFTVDPHRAVMLIGVSEGLVGIGAIFGPVLGGALYQAGGFLLPFLFLGGLQMITVIVCHFTVPTTTVDDSKSVKRSFPLKLARQFNALYGTLVLITAYVINSYVVANFSIYLHEKFNYGALNIGLCFLVGGISYAITSPLFGYLTDASQKGKEALIIFGSFFHCTALVLSGPASIILHWLGWSSPKLWLMYVTRAATGIGMAAVTLPTFSEMAFGARKLSDGKLDPILLYGVVGGLWNFGFCMGNIIGPLIGGLGSKMIAYENTLAIGGLVVLLLGLIRIPYAIKQHRSYNKDILDDKSPLISP